LALLAAAAVAAPTADAEAEADPEADPEAFYALHGYYPQTYAVAGAAPAAVAPVAAPLPYTAPNCVHETVDLVTNVCTPRAETVCMTKDVVSEEITTEKVCKEVVSTICDAAPAAYGAWGKKKRSPTPEAEAEAEADPEAYYALHGHYPSWYAGAAAIAPAAVAPAAVAPVAYHAPAYAAVAATHQVAHTIKTACHEVTTEHCVDNPIIKEVVTPIEQCHVVTKVTCEPVTNALPKTVCTPVEATVYSHVAAPYAYGHGWK